MHQQGFHDKLVCLLLVFLCLQVRIRGVAVGSVLNVRPSLDKVSVFIEVRLAGARGGALCIAMSAAAEWYS